MLHGAVYDRFNPSCEYLTSLYQERIQDFHKGVRNLFWISNFSWTNYGVSGMSETYFFQWGVRAPLDPSWIRTLYIHFSTPTSHYLYIHVGITSDYMRPYA